MMSRTRGAKKTLPFEEEDGFTSVSHNLNWEILKRRIIHGSELRRHLWISPFRQRKGTSAPIKSSKLTCTSEEKHKMHHAW